MKKRFTFVIALAIVCTFIFGCKKDKEEPIDILTSKTWKLATVDKNPSTNPKGKTEYWKVSGCLMADVFHFYNNGTYEVKNPNNGCVWGNSEKLKFNLSLNEIYFGTSDKFTIAEISKNQIKFYMPLNPLERPDEKIPDYIVVILE